MKKSIKAKKLSLNAATIRMLSGNDIRGARGGLNAPVDSECGSCNTCLPAQSCSACPSDPCPA